MKEAEILLRGWAWLLAVKIGTCWESFGRTGNMPRSTCYVTSNCHIFSVGYFFEIALSNSVTLFAIHASEV